MKVNNSEKYTEFPKILYHSEFKVLWSNNFVLAFLFSVGSSLHMCMGLSLVALLLPLKRESEF